MIDRILKLFQSPDEESGQVDPTLAAAALMFEVVWADHDVGEDEIQTMSAQLMDLFDLDATRIGELIEQTKTNHDTSVGVYSFTRIINEQLSQEEKFEILCAMWRIALADEQIDAFEEHTIRRIADLLYVPHARFIEAKLVAKNP